eukprot:18699-Prorocentrum_minimum.AAC.2
MGCYRGWIRGLTAGCYRRWIRCRTWGVTGGGFEVLHGVLQGVDSRSYRGVTGGVESTLAAIGTGGPVQCARINHDVNKTSVLARQGGGFRAAASSLCSSNKNHAVVTSTISKWRQKPPAASLPYAQWGIAHF